MLTDLAPTMGRADTPVYVDPAASTVPTCSSVAEQTHPSVTPVEPFFPRICSETPWVYDFAAVLGALKSLVGMINRNNNTNNNDNGNNRHREIIPARQCCYLKPHWYLFIVKTIKSTKYPNINGRLAKMRCSFRGTC